MKNFNSAVYWDKRYQSGGNSGAGSYNKFAEFKAGFINDFVVKNNVITVVEFGCGDGNQLSYANYQEYIGLDVSETAVNICREKFIEDDTKKFFLVEKYVPPKCDLALSLDVIYHLIEDNVFEKYMKQLFDTSLKYVIIYSSDTDDNADVEVAHVKHRNFTKYVADNFPRWEIFEKVKNIYPYYGDNLLGTFSDFYVFYKK
ncbi:class I SAM-dependent methyltransferase [Shewanella mangrovi]|uniref:class I SAM-dependent methyltransferase n=1 Tax=Shewanella mangrovi TaxID=1515746 RepID=UPI00068EA472|nr:class I SAM-dependent methyltransferase [Shewanella mangrovi]